MSGVGQLQEALEAAEKSRAYITRLDWLDIGESFLKARLYLDSDLFVQVYRNDKYSTTNFALIQGEIRIYGCDELSGKWHRHPADDPAQHDTSAEGQSAVSLGEF